VTHGTGVGQCHAVHLGQALVGQAIDQGMRNGPLTRKQAARLREAIEHWPGITLTCRTSNP
jgi:hypothetical protein